MPLVNVRLIEGVFTPEQKSEMIHQLTETMVRIEGENLRPVTWVIVEEVKSGDWGIGGKGLTTADVHALQGKAPARRPGLESSDRDTSGAAARVSSHRGGRAAASAAMWPQRGCLLVLAKLFELGTGRGSEVVANALRCVLVGGLADGRSVRPRAGEHPVGPSRSGGRGSVCRAQGLEQLVRPG